METQAKLGLTCIVMATIRMQIEFPWGEPILPQNYYTVIMYLHMSVQDCMGETAREPDKNRLKSAKLLNMNLFSNIKMVKK